MPHFAPGGAFDLERLLGQLVSSALLAQFGNFCSGSGRLKRPTGIPFYKSSKRVSGRVFREFVENLIN